MCSKRNPRKIDECIRRLVAALRSHPEFEILASCCGHGRYPMTLIVRGRANAVVYELISGTAIPRTRNFYRKDHVGFYYVPEVRLPNA